MDSKKYIGRLRREQAMKTAGRENPNRWAILPSTRVHGAAAQNNSRSIMRAGNQEKLRPQEKCFFLTSTFIKLLGTWHVLVSSTQTIWAAGN